MEQLLIISAIAVGLCFDTFAVSVSCGVSNCKVKAFNLIRFAGTLGVFQAIMPLLGGMGGLLLKDYIERYDHWIAFILLFVVGVKMIFEGLKTSTEKRNYFNMKNILVISLATSIDALAVGISFGLLKINICIASLIIGFITFIVSIVGVLLGNKIGEKYAEKSEIIGGIILILLGFNILREHIFYY